MNSDARQAAHFAGRLRASPYPQPAGIPSAVTERELAILQAYAHRAGRVLEIGTYYGRSAIGMALAGARVVTVDPHTGGPADQPDTWAPFLRNVARHADAIAAAGGAVDPVRITSAQFAANSARYSPEQRFGMAFIDGDHEAAAVRADAELALRYLRPRGLLAFHDVVLENWPGVFHTVRALEPAAGLSLLIRVGCLEVFMR